MTQYTDEYLKKVAAVVTKAVEDDDYEIYELDYGTVTVLVDGESLDLKFNISRYNAETYVYCTTFLNDDNKKTIGLTGYYDSWQGTEYDDKTFRVVTTRTPDVVIF